MQLRRSSAWQAIRVVCLGLALFVATEAEVLAQPHEQDAESPTPAPTPTPTPKLIDASKHGTVEAEIPAERESTAAVPNRQELRDRLLVPRWDRGGFFLGMGGHYAIEFTDQIGGMGALASGGGVSLRVGLRHDRFWQTEFTGVYTSKFKRNDVDFWAWGVYFGERFYPIKSRLQPYIGAHVGFLQLRGTNYRGGEFGFVPKVNVGLNLYQRPTFNWEFDLSYYVGEIGAARDSSFATATIGFTWF